MASSVIDAASADWQLIGDVSLSTRAAIARWCPPAAGTENDPILLTHDGNGGLAQPTLRFQAAAIIVYGAIIGDIEGNVVQTIDDAARSSPLPASDIDAAESRSATAACGLVIGRANNLDAGANHTFETHPLGDLNIAIYRVELFQEPIQTTPPAAANPSTTSDSTPGSLSGTSNDTQTTTSSGTSGPASSIGSIKAPQSSSDPILAIIIAVVAGVLMLLALITFLLCRRRRRPIPPDFTIDTYDSAAQLNDMPSVPGTASTVSGFATGSSGKAGLALTYDTRPYTVTSLPSSDDPYTRTDEKVRLLHVSDAKSWQGQSSASGSGATSPGMSSPGVGTVDLDGPPSGSSGRPQGQDPVQMAALSEAMQRAGFSPAALLESLNRVHARADVVDDDIAATSPTGTRTRPPQYRE